MIYNKLGTTNLDVSILCLGSMTFGEQNTEQQAHQQLDYAIAQGVNFIDTAELYAIPPKADTYGLTETYIGSWLKKSAKRDDVILATKVAGPADGWLPHIRDEKTRHLDRRNIEAALNGSLQRLQTDYVDLYQLHWPDRKTNFFGQLGYSHVADDEAVSIEETLAVLNDLVIQGKVRYIGLSNETPWGVMRFVELADRLNLPRVVSVQNPYSLLNRTFEIGLAEVAIREQVGLLAYSPLGFGVLSGKYLEGAAPEGARLTLFPDYDRYSNENSVAATAAYVRLARDHGLDPAQMALAYINSRQFLTSNIIGATTMEQLKSNIESASINLSNEVIEQIENIHLRYPNPSP
ncbi:MAG: NADP(H)-dependent aldo-keto reductase [Gammaproteobacteria bacterium]|nr:NADP(H)-dependent aldo-keto reductase [Gammaproteobacteria bacterium]MCW9005143.1 NADP(H)-dependent aldo-keto reductase [Gammaproteobacteria bacterium]